ncbi:hypothetical protein FA09DRAFT_330538 [Tilletiopsis washingtonensis]|uniref:Telomerase reverse transcriptase n=1 Tax=Tilletiopsis washingtonensis TaxID=58919 RepID=A0A316Z8V2_9BASI|nr:hypothetical protein FA09DRAFT_330538 [Tilletiopsis washingtonensis]PWN97372.1 hypothetical protein FA09DRAFT_330538 [Tilletiopsis washingtonensis]
MAMSIKSRAHIIFMDTALNGEAVVHHNVYQAFLLTAVKLLAYLKALRQPPSERARTCLFIIQQIVTFSHSIIRARADAARSLHAGASCGLRLHHVRW